MQNSNPYKQLQAHSFWKNFSKNSYSIQSLPFIDNSIAGVQKISSAGSCFAANIISYIEQSGLNYIRVETSNDRNNISSLEDKYGYNSFSAKYGHIYTVRHLKQLLQRSLGVFSPLQSFWEGPENTFIDPFRPGLKYRAKSIEEFEKITLNHLKNTLMVFQKSDLFIFTLGLTELWRNKQDGSVYPSCPGTISGEFNDEIYEFYNLSVDDVFQDLTTVKALLNQINPNLKIALSISPVPLFATATNRHISIANNISKSTLVLAVNKFIENNSEIIYIPAFEAVLFCKDKNQNFEKDGRTVKKEVITEIMDSFLRNWNLEINAHSRHASDEIDVRLYLESECEETSIFK
jgi:hypothetical protein